MDDIRLLLKIFNFNKAGAERVWKQCMPKFSILGREKGCHRKKKKKDSVVLDLGS